MLKIGLVGCGTIGNIIACEIDNNPMMELTCCWDLDKEKYIFLAEKLKEAPSFSGLDEMGSRVDLIIEAASHKVVKDLLVLAAKNNKKLLIISVGGLIGYQELIDKFAESQGELFIPSGALAGLDAVKSLPKEEIHSSTLTTCKHPNSLAGAPFFEKNHVNLEELSSSTLIFEGYAIDALTLFPKNINVAAALSLVGIGPYKTGVRIFADPNLTRNTHEICVEGSFGKIVARTENVPSPGNPKTSFLTALSVISSTKGIVSNIHLGT